MDFRNVYAQGFARVAACTLPVALADPATNAERVLAEVRACHDEGVAVALFPELSLSGYAIDDLLLQDVLLDAVDDAVVTIAEATAKLLPVVVVGAPLRHGNRLYNCAVVIHRGEVLGVAPKSFLPNYREFYEKRHFASGAGAPGRVHRAPALARRRRRRRGPLRARPRLHAGGRARPRGARRDLRGHVGAGPAEPRGRPRRRDGPAQPLGLPHHRRARRGPPPPRPVGELAVQRGLPVLRGERR